MSDKHADMNASPRTKPAKVEDLPDRETTAADSADVKGGSFSSGINTGLIIPCVRTIKGGISQ
jgi:hypothetical protein